MFHEGLNGTFPKPQLTVLAVTAVATSLCSVRPLCCWLDRSEPAAYMYDF